MIRDYYGFYCEQKHVGILIYLLLIYGEVLLISGTCLTYYTIINIYLFIMNYELIIIFILKG